ncbi:MAG: tRNA (adenosine(37)-N6)-threonylcarbamoyltransferase complex ATPase subunit type 1 TsaE [Candidatus Sumerlaeia bacterium]|nr:tRNA (adenosine(37)-N6)-threonylcarbamoyltransferase complex ATPase subunit type 1 TsaE [Candidatus Sumerlaeia bacterium]
MQITHLTYSEQETIALGKELGKSLAGGEIIALCGQLGAGKTSLTKGIAMGLDIAEVITSSSFVLASTYHGRLKLHHLDFYRLQTGEDFFSIGFDDYLMPDSVVVVEWADKFLEFLPASALKIELIIIDSHTRKLIFSASDDNSILIKWIQKATGKK